VACLGLEMTRQRRSVDLSTKLWATLETMAHDMSVDVDSLLNQAIFTFARFNGYATPGPLVESASGATPPVDQPPTNQALLPSVEGPVTDVEPGYFLDESAVQVRGVRKDDDWSGEVQLLDAQGALLHQRSLGGSAVEAQVAVLLADEVKEAAFWLRQHTALASKAQIGEATLALARALGVGATAETFKLWHQQHAMPLMQAVAADRAERAQAILQEMHGLGATVEAKATFLVDELRQGSHASTILKLLALEVKSVGSMRTAGDLIRAAKALDPDNKALYAPSQVLIELELGRIDSVRIALDEVAHDDGTEVKDLRLLSAVLYPAYDFWPKHDEVLALNLSEEGLAGPRDLAALRVAVQKSATRVLVLRDRLKDLHPKATWLPPDVGHLLPKGPLPLQGDDGLDVSVERSTIALLGRARAEWAGLCWLCWLGGLDEVALPGRNAKPRSPGALRHALGLKQMVLELLLANESLDEHLEGEPLRHAQAVAELPYGGVALGRLPVSVAEVALGEVNGALLPALWAEEAVRVSPWQPEALSADDEPARGATESIPKEPSSDPAESHEEPSGSVDTGSVAVGDSLEVWLERESEGVVHLQGQKRYLLGRESTCEVVLASPRVSREHAEVVFDAEGRVVLNDLGSSNGTFFNGERIESRVLLDGDEVTFGNEVVRFFVSEPRA
jgi:hypothetical protein